MFHAWWDDQKHVGAKKDATSDGTVLEMEGSRLDVAYSIVGTVLRVKGNVLEKAA